MVLLWNQEPSTTLGGNEHVLFRPPDSSSRGLYSSKTARFKTGALAGLSVEVSCFDGEGQDLPVETNTRPRQEYAGTSTRQAGKGLEVDTLVLSIKQSRLARCIFVGIKI